MVRRCPTLEVPAWEEGARLARPGIVLARQGRTMLHPVPEKRGCLSRSRASTVGEHTHLSPSFRLYSTLLQGAAAATTSALQLVEGKGAGCAEVEGKKREKAQKHRSWGAQGVGKRGGEGGESFKTQPLQDPPPSVPHPALIYDPELAMH